MKKIIILNLLFNTVHSERREESHAHSAHFMNEEVSIKCFKLNTKMLHKSVIGRNLN